MSYRGGTVIVFHFIVRTLKSLLLNEEDIAYDNSYKELKSITTGSTEYKFTYNSFGDASKITAGDRTLTPKVPTNSLILTFTRLA